MTILITGATGLIGRALTQALLDQGQPVRIGSRRPYLQAYRVATDAREVSKTLSAVLPQGVLVNEDGDEETIHIFGTEAQHREVQELLRQLEGSGGAQTVTVIPLSSKDPLAVASTLRTVFLKDGTNAPTIEQQTAKLPSDLFLWAALGSMGASLALQLMGRKEESNFIGQWAPSFLILGLYNKIVKVAGSDRIHQDRESTQEEAAWQG